MVNEITFVKLDTSGNTTGNTVTVYATDIAENYTNKLFFITPGKNKSTQETGPNDTKIVDLLRVVHQFVIKCYIASDTNGTYTPKQIKSQLITIYKGGETNGGVVRMTYDGSNYEGYIEKLNIVEKSADGEWESNKDYARYECSITFVEGIGV